MTRRLVALLLFAAAICCATPATTDSSASAKKVDHILIEKSAHKMTLLLGDKVVKTYKVALSTEPVGPKERVGDHRVPEGSYIIEGKIPHSQFHMALRVSYPNAADRERAKKLGVAPGGNIEIHGLPDAYAAVGSLHRLHDWTDGCIALTNAEIEEICPLIAVGTPVQIRP